MVEGFSYARSVECRKGLMEHHCPTAKNHFKMILTSVSFSTAWSTQYSKRVWPLNSLVSRRVLPGTDEDERSEGLRMFILRIQYSTLTISGHHTSFSFNSNPGPARGHHSLGGDQAKRGPTITKLQFGSATPTFSLT